MCGWRTHEGTALALPVMNIDTDQLIPARFMSVPRAEGYGAFLLYDMRRDAQGTLRKDFPLNAYREATIMVAGRNFGSGSSREAAVYALVDAGFRAVIAPSFGDIFASNAVNNGLLPATVDDESHAALEAALSHGPQDITIDIEHRSISLPGMKVGFDLDDSWATKLINGWDDIDFTQQHGAAIADFRKTRSQAISWAWPKGAD